MTMGQQWLARVSVVLLGLAVVSALIPSQIDIFRRLPGPMGPLEGRSLQLYLFAVRAGAFLVLVGVVSSILAAPTWWCFDRVRRLPATGDPAALRSWTIALGVCTAGALVVVGAAHVFGALQVAFLIVWAAVAVGWSAAAATYHLLELLRATGGPKLRAFGLEVGADGASLIILLVGPLALAPLLVWARRLYGGTATGRA